MNPDQKQNNLLEWFGSRMRNIERTGAAALQSSAAVHETLLELKDIVLRQATIELQQAHPNPLNRHGRQCFSQSDEDGITLEIVRRLGIESGVFAEFGVGNGLENNTLILGALGWRGFWVGAEELAFDSTSLARLIHIRDWITRENVHAHALKGLAMTGAGAVDLASLDLDGNDIHLVEDLLENGFRPKVFIVEYNAKFPPPARFRIRYDPDHRWTGDDYFGAALTNFVDLFERFDFTLVCCNAHTGCNAFFVRNEFLPSFADVPREIDRLYAPPRYHLYRRFGHKPSAKVIETIFSD